MKSPVMTPPNTTNRLAKSRKGILRNSGRFELKAIAPTVSKDPTSKTDKDKVYAKSVKIENFMVSV